MAFYNQLAPGQAASAGLVVGTPGERLGDRFGDSLILAVMREYGLDMSKNMRIQLTRSMISDYEKVVVMAPFEVIPEWLATSSNTVIWTVQDASNESLDQTRTMAAEIKVKVEGLTGLIAEARS